MVSRPRIEKRIHKVAGVEWEEVVHAFPDTDPTNRELQAVGNGEDHAALRCSIQFGEYDARDPGGGAKSLGLLDAVGACGRIKHQQHFVWCPRHLSCCDVADLLKLFHQICPGMEASGGIDEDLVKTAGRGCGDRIKDNGRRVRPFLLVNHRRRDSLGPHLELFNGRGAKGIGRGEDHRTTGFLTSLGQLGNSRCFPGAVDAHHERDLGSAGSDRRLRGCIGLIEDLEQQFSDGRSEFFGRGDLTLADPVPQVIDQPDG